MADIKNFSLAGSTDSSDMTFQNRAKIGFVVLPDFSKLASHSSVDASNQVPVIVHKDAMGERLQVEALATNLWSVVGNLYENIHFSEPVKTVLGRNAICNSADVYGRGSVVDLARFMRDDDDKNALQALEFQLVGQLKDRNLEKRFRRKFKENLIVLCVWYFHLSRIMMVILFSSAASLGASTGWGIPVGLSGSRSGGKLAYSDVNITNWLWVIEGVLFLISLVVPPIFVSLLRFWGPHFAMGTQCFIFGAGCLAAMICIPSVLTIGLPVAFLAQVFSPTLSLLFISSYAVLFPFTDVIISCRSFQWRRWMFA